MVATQDLVPTLAMQGGHVPGRPVPDGADNDDNSFLSDTESEGGFGVDNADDTGPEVHIPNERAQGPNFATDGEGRRRLEQEDDAAGFLGVKMERDSNTGLLEMKQTGLMERVVEALGLDDGYARGKHTPAETKPLVKDEDGVAAVEGFSYSSVVGMLLYLSGHT
jgi:hypothetical protein